MEKKNESVKCFSDDYIFGKAVPNFVPPVGVFADSEVRKLITQLGLSIVPDAPFIELERKFRVSCVWKFRRDYEVFESVRKEGFLLRGRSSIPRAVPTCSFDYQLSLFD